jgi:hypothetical protein
MATGCDSISCKLKRGFWQVIYISTGIEPHETRDLLQQLLLNQNSSAACLENL